MKIISLFILSLLSLLYIPCSGQYNYIDLLEDKSPRIDTSYWINPMNLLAFDTTHAWVYWKKVDNYTFNKDRGNIPMIADLNALHPYFRDKVMALISTCKKKGIELSVVESFRTKAKQAEYFGMGKKYTRSVGGKSKHQYGLAVDVVPIIDGVAVWDDKLLWRKIGIEGERLGLRWGGRWRAPYDPAHFEWTGGADVRTLAAGLIPKPKTELYPCLEEDIRLLTKYWQAWETEQTYIVKHKKTKSTSMQKP